MEWSPFSSDSAYGLSLTTVTSTTTTLSSSISSTLPAMGIGYSQNIVTSIPATVSHSSSQPSAYSVPQDVHSQLYALVYKLCEASHFSSLAQSAPAVSSIHSAAVPAQQWTSPSLKLPPGPVVPPPGVSHPQDQVLQPSQDHVNFLQHQDSCQHQVSGGLSYQQMPQQPPKMSQLPGRKPIRD